MINIIMCKKNLLFLTIVFAVTSLLAGCGKSSGSSVNKPLNIFNIDNYIKFGKETYRPKMPMILLIIKIQINLLAILSNKMTLKHLKGKMVTFMVW